MVFHSHQQDTTVECKIFWHYKTTQIHIGTSITEHEGYRESKQVKRRPCSLDYKASDFDILKLTGNYIVSLISVNLFLKETQYSPEAL